MKLLLALVLGVGGCLGPPTVSGSWTADNMNAQGTCYEHGWLDDAPTEHVIITIRSNREIIALDHVPCSDGGFSVPVPPATDVRLSIETQHSGLAEYAIDRVGDSDVDVGDVKFVE